MKKLLIANRGEIACRIIRTARKRGIRTVAVYADADRHALHVRLADEAIALGGNETRESYLNQEKVLAACRATGVDAVHPGYGFLSENPEFASALRSAGITFIGPSPEAMRLLGDKLGAKRLAAQEQVPMLPSLAVTTSGADALQQVQSFVDQHGFPIIIKAAAGGGGRGMRKVFDSSNLAEQLASAQREAGSFFGDDRVFVEKLLQHARHIEVQILGDQYGNVIHLYDRDCTLQRHHQKIIEEAPAFGLSAETRGQLLSAAVRLGTAAKYSNAGTVEFLYDGSSRFYLLEVNSRLQVEHPVTEMITGVDLVGLQIDVSLGRNLSTNPVVLPPIDSCQHAIECRICFEDPDANFRSGTGTLSETSFGVAEPSNEYLRVDHGFESGDRISHYFDSLAAKLVVRGATRSEALERAHEALSRIIIAGVPSNIGFLQALTVAPTFIDGKHHIQWAVELLAALPSARRKWFESWCAALLSGGIGWRISGGPRLVAYSLWHEESYRLEMQQHSQGALNATLTKSNDPKVLEEARITQVQPLSPTELELCIDGNQVRTRVVTDVRGSWVHSVHGNVLVSRDRPSLHRETRAQGGRGAGEQIRSPLPGKIVSIRASHGTVLTAGSTLAVLESMKMEHQIIAPHDLAVVDVQVKEGQVVEARQVLFSVGPTPDR